MLDNSKTDFLPPVEVNEFLPPIARWINFAGLFVIAVVGLAFPLASVIKYKVTVKAQATIRPAGELRLVQAATEGEVMSISVKPNQKVKKGDIIATIDNSRLETKKSQLQTNISQAQLQQIRVKAQISSLDRQIDAESDRIDRTIASAKAEKDRSNRDYRDKKLITIAEVEEAYANLNSIHATYLAAKAKQDRYQSISTAGALSLNQLEEAKLEVERQKQAIQAAKARLQRAKAALNPSNAEVAIAILKIARERATGEATLANLNKEKEALLQQQIEIVKNIDRDSRELQQVEIDLNKTAIAATADGIISQLSLRNPGQTVRSGEEIAQIVPGNAPLEIKARVSPSDIGKLESGQDVQMRVSACPYPDYGTLKGVISQISEDTIDPQNNNINPLSGGNNKMNPSKALYEVTIKPETLSLGKGKNQCSIQLGMEGRADIISREESLLKFILRKAKLITDLE